MKKVLIIICLLAVWSCTEEVGVKPAPAAQQEYPVGVAYASVVDPSRNNRELPLKIYFPANSTNRHAVILFSHGGQGTNRSNEAYQYFGEWMAANGYICIHPTQQRTTAPLVVDKPRDISFLIDLLRSNELVIEGFEGQIDATTIGMAGHSFGAYTVMALAGAKLRYEDGPITTFTDNRIKAFLALSPSGRGRFGLYVNSSQNNSWEDITKPVYVIVGANELGDDGEGNFIERDWRKQPFKYMPTGDKYESVIPRAEHYHFNDNGDKGAGEAAEVYTQQFVKKNAVRFFDYYLLNRGNKSQIQQADDLAGVQHRRK